MSHLTNCFNCSQFKHKPPLFSIPKKGKFHSVFHHYFFTPNPSASISVGHPLHQFTPYRSCYPGPDCVHCPPEWPIKEAATQKEAGQDHVQFCQEPDKQQEDTGCQQLECHSPCTDLTQPTSQLAVFQQLNQPVVPDPVL